MRHSLLQLAASLLLVTSILGCSDSSTDPAPPDAPKPLVSVSIGPEGGSLATADFSLEVPAGAFATGVALKLFTFTDDFPAEGVPATGLFRVAGLPSSFDAPLTLRLRANTDPDPASEPLLLLGEDVFIKTRQTNGPAWHPVEAEVVDGFLTATLPAHPAESVGKDFEFLDLPLGGTFYYSSLLSSGGHFKIYYPLGMLSPAGELGGYLEAAHTVFQGMGFSYAARDRWPVRAIVLALPQGTSGESVPSIWGHNYASLRFSTALLPQADVMRVTAGHEFFHLVQAYYDPRGAYDQATQASRHLWLDEATAVWSEGLFSSILGYVSTSRSGLVMEPFEGLQAGCGDQSGWHGYGMSALVKYLVSHNTDAAVKTLYDRILAGDHPAEAVRTVLGGFDPQLNGFFQEYFAGQLYGEGEIPYMIAGNWGEFKVTTDADTLKTFTKFDPALSASLFKIVLNNPNLSDQTYAEISLEGDGPATVNVFKYKPATGATLLGSDSQLVTVDDLRGLMDDGFMVIVMVTAMQDDAPTYFAANQHVTTIHLKQGGGLLDVLKRSQRVSYRASLLGGQHDFRFTNDDTTYVMENQNNFPNMGGSMIPGDIFGGPYPALQFTGNSFTAHIAYSTWSWDLSGAFSADCRTLQTVQAYGEADLGGGDVTVFSFQLGNLPLGYEDITADSCTLVWYTLGTGSMSNIFYLRTFPSSLEDGTVGEATIEYIGSNWDSARAMFSFGQSSP